MASRAPVSRRATASGKGSAAVAAMVAIAAPFLAVWEGKVNQPYFDIVGVKTVCYGETEKVESRRYSDEECGALLRARIPDYAAPVAKLAPGIEASPYEWAAHTSLAYNIGVAAYSRSSIVREFNKGNRVEACRRFRLYDKAGGKVVRGLQFRRQGEGARIGEYELCLVGAVPIDLGAKSQQAGFAGKER